MIESPLALLLLLAAFVAAPLLLRRYRGHAPDGLRVLGRTALSKHAVVAVVAVGERRLLLGAGDRGVQLLSEIDLPTDGDEPAAAVATAATTMTSLDRMDAVATSTSTGDGVQDMLSTLPALTPSVEANAGPGTGLVDRLRAMTVRTPPTGRPLDVPRRR